jgi:hypothetical protein
VNRNLKLSSSEYLGKPRKLPLNVERSVDSSRRIVVVRVGTHAPACNDSKSIVVGDHLVKGAFHSIYLLLHNSHDSLDHCKREGLIDVKRELDVHDCNGDSPVLVACMVILEL